MFLLQNTVGGMNGFLAGLYNKEVPSARKYEITKQD
jgi:hypothetical protein